MAVCRRAMQRPAFFQWMTFLEAALSSTELAVTRAALAFSALFSARA